jgi:hypothetical protein
MADPNHVNGIVAFLRAQAPITARTSLRIFGPDGVPKSENASMPQQAIVVSPAGGLGAFGSAYQEYGDKRVDIVCYGKTQAESYALWLVVRPLMKQLRRAVVSVSATEQALIHWAKISAEGNSGIDPITEWPATPASFQVLVSEVAIPA